MAENKKQRKESLLFKYGVIAFLEILAFISVFLIFISRNIKGPINTIYEESIENFLDSAVDNVKMWFENQVTVMKVFQRAIVEPTVLILCLIFSGLSVGSTMARWKTFTTVT